MQNELNTNTRRNFSHKALLYFIAIILFVFLNGHTAANIVVMLWPKTEGEVIELRHSNGILTNVLSSQYTTVVYQYKVAGHIYEASGSRTDSRARNFIVPYFGQFSIAKCFLSQIIDPKYPVGKKVIVHYDPTQPERACLEIHLNPFWL